MALKEKFEVPSCEMTGLPLLVQPAITHGPWDFDHCFFQKKAPELQRETQGGRALRVCRGQILNKSVHKRKHGIFKGARLPAKESVSERFGLCVLACAGVVPRQAITMPTKNEFEVVDLSYEQMVEIADPNRMHIEPKNTPAMRRYNRGVIGMFFAEYALSQSIDQVVSGRVIRGFLSPSATPQRKFELGNLILREASMATIEPLNEYYQDLRTEGYVAPTGPDGLSQTVRHFFTKDRYPDFHGVITSSLLRVA